MASSRLQHPAKSPIQMRTLSCTVATVALILLALALTQRFPDRATLTPYPYTRLNDHLKPEACALSPTVWRRPLDDLLCVRLDGNIIAFFDILSIGYKYVKSGFWHVDVVEPCTYVHVWIVDFNLFYTDDVFQDALERLPNIPPTISIDRSSELGNATAIFCRFNALVNNGTIPSSTHLILASQSQSLQHKNQRPYTRYWLIPKEIDGDQAGESVASSFHGKSRIMCLGGFPRVHKLQFLAEIDHRGLLDGIIWSGAEYWGDATRMLDVMHAVGYTQSEIAALSAFKPKLPHLLDVDTKVDKRLAGAYNRSLYDQAWLQIVLESDHQLSLDHEPCPRSLRYTEKTLKAFYSGGRAIFVAAPATLELLRSHGFRTFHPFINETYDVIPTFRAKADALLGEISRLLDMSAGEFNEFLDNTAEIVEHNRRWVLSEEFLLRVRKQSLYAFGISDDEGFESKMYDRVVNELYRQAGLKC
jgi:hypothetical protein